MTQGDTGVEALLDRFSLMNFDGYENRPRVDARRKLESRTEIVAGKDGVISISVDDSDARRAADLANGYVDELEKLTKTLAVSEAGKRRIFFEPEVEMARDETANAEGALKQTPGKTRRIFLALPSEAIIV